MNIDSAIDFLQSQGYEVRKRRKVIYDSSFLGLESRGERLDSSASNTTPKDDLEQLRLDAAKAREEMISSLDANANKRNNDHSGKSLESLREIARANRDAANDRLEGYKA
jgi:hypothetical protein